MSKPHPKGPRTFRKLFEADRPLNWPSGSAPASPAGDWPFTITEANAMTQVIQVDQGARTVRPAPGIDLTSFAGRYSKTCGESAVRFELPASFSRRLNALRPTPTVVQMAEIDPGATTSPVAVEA